MKALNTKLKVSYFLLDYFGVYFTWIYLSKINEQLVSILFYMVYCMCDFTSLKKATNIFAGNVIFKCYIGAMRI